jgi:hypothetical protein
MITLATGNIKNVKDLRKGFLSFGLVSGYNFVFSNLEHKHIYVVLQKKKSKPHQLN